MQLILYVPMTPKALGFGVVCEKDKIICSWVGPDDKSSFLDFIDRLDYSRTPLPPSSPLAQKVEAALKDYIAGNPAAISKLPISLPPDIPQLSKAVYKKLQLIRSGDLITYDELGAATGLRYSPRAIGQIVGRNPIPLIIPCHRVVGKTSPGGFSAIGGLTTKEKLLNLEGLSLHHLKPKTIFDRQFSRPDTLDAFIQLAPEFKGLVNHHPFFSTSDAKPVPVFQSLSRAVVGQQISTKAAESIFAKILRRQNKGRWLDPKWVEKSTESELRQCGVSSNKVSTLKRLALAELDRSLPSLGQIKSTPDYSLRRQLSHIKGIGPWSVEMYMMFSLGRLNVFSPGDLGLQKGLSKLSGINATNPTLSLRTTLPWQPYRTLASWYLWRSL